MLLFVMTPELNQLPCLRWQVIERTDNRLVNMSTVVKNLLKGSP